MGSASDFGKDLGLLHETVVTGRKAGWGQKEWAQLAHDEELMRRFLSVLRGHAEIVSVKHIVDVDCSAPAWCPDGWTVAPEEEQIASRLQGEFEITPESLALHLDPGQEGKGVMIGTALRTALAGKPVLPANVLDRLLEHPELIPESWKGKSVFFWGTVYRGSNGSLCVRCLYWRGDRWDWLDCWLESDWISRLPAAVPASI